MTRTRPFLRSTASWPWDARVLRAHQAVGLEARSCSRRARGICDQDTEALELLNAIADESAAIQGNPPTFSPGPSLGSSAAAGECLLHWEEASPMPLPQRSQPDAEDKFYDSTEQPARKNNNNNNKIISFVHSFIRRGWPRRKGGCLKTGMSETSVHPRSSCDPCLHRYQGPLFRPHRCHPCHRPD
jgi:hypothetical protein